MSQGITPRRPLEPRPTAIIVGASSGIGKALAQRLAREGYVLVLLGRRENLLRSICSDINTTSAGQARGYAHNVLDTDQIPALYQTITSELGGLDLFVYNAGIMFPNNPESYDTGNDVLTMQVNILGAMAWLNPVSERFKQAGAGHIVGIGSIAGDRGRRGIPAYTSSKSALHTYLEALRNRLSRHGVTVTTIKPGQVDTDMLKNADKVRSPVSPELAAELVWKAIKKRKNTVYVPVKWAVVALVLKHLPSFIFRRLDI